MFYHWLTVQLQTASASYEEAPTWLLIWSFQEKIRLNVWWKLTVGGFAINSRLCCLLSLTFADSPEGSYYFGWVRRRRRCWARKCRHFNLSTGCPINNKTSSRHLQIWFADWLLPKFTAGFQQPAWRQYKSIRIVFHNGDSCSCSPTVLINWCVRRGWRGTVACHSSECYNIWEEDHWNKEIYKELIIFWLQRLVFQMGM